MNRILKAKIIEKDGTQGAFSARVGDDVATVSRVINGLQILPFWKKVIWANALDSKIDDLFEHEEEVDRADRQLWEQCEEEWSRDIEVRKEFRGRFETFYHYKRAERAGYVR